MTIATPVQRRNGKGSAEPVAQRAGPSAARRRRQVPWIVAGVLLILGCALAFGVVSLRIAGGEQVLAVDRAVPLGQRLAPQDLRVVRIAPSAGLEPVLATSEASVLGHPVAVPLEPGTLLTQADLGTTPRGASNIVALALKAGAYPPDLGPGQRVEVVPVANSSVGSQQTSSSPLAAQSAPSAPVRAVVSAVDQAPSSSNADAVISLAVSPSQAASVADLGAEGQAALVALPAGPGS